MNKYPTVTFRDFKEETISDGLSLPNVQDVVFKKLLPNLEYSITKNNKSCILCHVKSLEHILEDPKFKIIIPNTEYYETLKTLEEYYLNLEDYETCSHIVELQKIIKDGR